MNEQAKFETITVLKAQKLLDNNKINRPVSRRNFEFIVTGLSNEAFKYIDTGKTRTAADILGIEKVPYANIASGVISSVVYFKNNGFAFNSPGRGIKMLNSEISEFCHKNKEQILESIKYGTSKKNKILSKVALAAFHYIFNEKDSADADYFCHKLAEGTGLESDSPIYVLRQRLIQEIRSKSKLKKIERNALICKSWNAYHQKKKVKNLRWDSINEPFPKPI